MPLDEHRQHVLQVLCDNDRLEPSLTALNQSVVLRKDKPCGLFFQARGPRQLKTYAIWAGEENRILFFNSIGERFAGNERIKDATTRSSSPAWRQAEKKER